MTTHNKLINILIFSFLPKLILINAPRLYYIARAIRWKVKFYGLLILGVQACQMTLLILVLIKLKA